MPDRRAPNRCIRKTPAPRHAPHDAAGGIAEPTLYRQLKRFFERCAERMGQGGDRAGAARLKRASTHWLRHTHASHTLASGVPIQVAQQNLGHASIATTTLYVSTEKAARLRAMQWFWAKGE